MAAVDTLCAFKKTQPAAGQPVSVENFVRMQLDLEKSIDSLVRFCRTVVPAKSIVHANLSATEIAGFFDATGLGKAGQPYAGWAICNGENGTPSLDGKFIRSEVSAAGATGGSDSSAHTHAIDHNHASFTSGSTVLSAAQIPAHTHSLGNVPEFIGGGAGDYNISSVGTDWEDINNTGSTGGGGGHTHDVDVPSITATSGAASATDNRPAYYELVPLMRL